MSIQDDVAQWTCGKFSFVQEYMQKNTKFYLVKCTNCGAVFGRSKRGLQKYNTRCPNCYKPKCESYLKRLARAEYSKTEYEKEKECVICKKVFHNSDERRKTCSQECAKILRASNHGLQRFRHKGGKIKDYGITLIRVYERDNGKCWICGRQTNFDDVLFTDNGQKYCGDTHPVRDHIIPLSRGGEESWENIRLACWRCNREKSDAIVNIEKTEKGQKIVVSERCGKKDGSISIVQYTLDRTLIKIYESIRQASRETGIPSCQISAARVGRQKTAHGYIWETYTA